MKELILWLVTALVPPPDADRRRNYRWRVTIATVVMANALATGGFIAFALGSWPFVSAGFADKSDLDKQTTRIARVEKNQLDTKIMDTVTRQCMAKKMRDAGDQGAVSAVQFATERLQDELAEYKELTHERYRLPDCSEL